VQNRYPYLQLLRQLDLSVRDLFVIRSFAFRKSLVSILLNADDCADPISFVLVIFVENLCLEGNQSFKNCLLRYKSLDDFACDLSFGRFFDF